MSEPVIADKKTAVLELEAGSYYWCKCGQSQNKTFCDGSHQGSDFTPIMFEVAEKKTLALCNCKYTTNPPYCDGSHSKL